MTWQAITIALLIPFAAMAQETSFHAAGYGNTELDIPLDGDPAGFGTVAFNPIFLWREGDSRAIA